MGLLPGKLHSPADNPLNAIVLSGGSAFGLAASDGVMRYLEEHGIGYETGFAKVPLVCQSCIYDLSIGRSDIRPDAAMGYAACQDAEHPHPVSGILGGQCWQNLWPGQSHKNRSRHVCSLHR